MSKKLSYVGPNSSISAVSHHVKPIILCWTKLMDISCRSSCQTNYLTLDQIHGYQLSVTRQSNYLVLDQINGHQLTLIMSNQLPYVGRNSWISAVSHHVKPITLCWTKFMDISCQSSCQTNYLMLDEIHGYQLSVIMSNQLPYVGRNSWISAVSNHVRPIILCWMKFMDISQSSCQTNKILCWTKLMEISSQSWRQTNYLMLDQINGYQLTVIMSNQLSHVGWN